MQAYMETYLNRRWHICMNASIYGNIYDAYTLALLYICMHICEYICIYKNMLGPCHICRCARIYGGINLCVLAYMRSCTHIWEDPSMYAGTSDICMQLFEHICIYAYTLISNHICIYACISGGICACILAYMHVYNHIWEHICIYAGIFNANINRNMSADMLAYTMFESVYGGICAYTLAYMHNCKHIRRHICIYSLPP